LNIYEFKKGLIGYFDKSSMSEYQSEVQREYKINFNDLSMDKKLWNILEVSHNYDLNTDIKLGSKSLLLKYFEGMLTDIEYSDEVNTINGLLDLLADESIISNMLFTNETIDFNVSFQELNSKVLTKMLCIELLKEEYEANFYNLDYNEIIILQLDLIENICRQNKNLKYICLVDVPKVTDEIFKKINFMDLLNLKTIIIANDFENNYFDVTNTLLIAEKMIDLYDEETIYDLTMNHKLNISMDEMIDHIIKKLSTKFTNITTDLLLNKLSN